MTRIAIDVETMFRPGYGIAKALAAILPRLPERLSDVEFTLLHLAGRDEQQLPAHSRFSSRPVPRVRTARLSDLLSYAAYFATHLDEFDLVHFPHARIFPLFWRLAPARVVTVHDAGYVLMRGKEWGEPLMPPAAPTMRLMTWTLRRHHSRITRVVTTSESSRRQITAVYGVPRDKICVITYGADPSYRPDENPAVTADYLRRVYGVEKPFILCVARLQPHKNLVRLIDAFARVKRSRVALHRLVIVGKVGWKGEDVLRAAEASGLGEQVRFVNGHVPEDDLPKFYSAADLFIFPSLFEGFGLPIVEAMACGTPVLSSRATSLPEVAGDAAILFDPLNVVEMADAIADALGNPALLGSLRARGLERASRFTWERAADELAAVYRGALVETQRPVVAGGPTL